MKASWMCYNKDEELLEEHGWKRTNVLEGNENGGWRALVFTNERRNDDCMVAFRGSVADNWLKANLKAGTKKDGKDLLHLGFYEITKAAAKKLRTDMNGMCAEKNIIVTGHSLGGAMAQIFTWALLKGKFDLEKRNKQNVRTITFAQPQVFFVLRTLHIVEAIRCPSEIRRAGDRNQRIVLIRNDGDYGDVDPMSTLEYPSIDEFLNPLAVVASSGPQFCTLPTQVKITGDSKFYGACDKSSRNCEGVGVKFWKEKNTRTWPKKDPNNVLNQILKIGSNPLAWTDAITAAITAHPLHMQNFYLAALKANKPEECITWH